MIIIIYKHTHAGIILFTGITSLKLSSKYLFRIFFKLLSNLKLDMECLKKTLSDINIRCTRVITYIKNYLVYLRYRYLTA